MGWCGAAGASIAGRWQGPAQPDHRVVVDDNCAGCFRRIAGKPWARNGGPRDRAHRLRRGEAGQCQVVPNQPSRMPARNCARLVLSCAARWKRLRKQSPWTASPGPCWAGSRSASRSHCQGWIVDAAIECDHQRFAEGRNLSWVDGLELDGMIRQAPGSGSESTPLLSASCTICSSTTGIIPLPCKELPRRTANRQQQCTRMRQHPPDRRLGPSNSRQRL